MGELVDRFPLFPLGIVALPSELVPLHIFEERYKTMVGECLEAGAPFGVLWLSDSGLRDIGCSVVISEVLDELDDGRLNILCRGDTPFRLLERVDGMAYPAGTVEMLDDEPGSDPDQGGSVARERYAELVERATGERPGAEALAALGAYEMAATIELGLDEKQLLLEERTEAGRMSELSALIAAALGRLEFAEAAGERASSNGHLPRPGAS
ncbi:MAG TPA: LON peptidase substrate-binding domain-containing protein [Thermoleophilaceae bacterium]|nr:LON peptidase substrate-binding domain-containing protein [Thermoleophilaceae bacterium]